MEDKELEVRVGESSYRLGKDNIGYVTLIGEVDEKAANGHKEAGLKILNMIEGTINVLVDVNEAGKLSSEVRSVFKEFSEHEKSRKVAILGLNPVARVVASFVMGVSRNKDMHFFKTREEALAWLKE